MRLIGIGEPAMLSPLASDRYHYIGGPPIKVTGAGPGFVATDAVGRLCLSLEWRVALPGEKARSPVAESTRQLRLTNGLEAADVVG
jgi:hypothetical protein